MTSPPAGGRRVLVVTQGFPRRPDDHRAPFLLDHARALAGAGCRVTVLCPSAPGLAPHERWGDVDVVRFRYAPRRLEVFAYSGAMHRDVRTWRVLLLPLFLVGYLLAVRHHSSDADVVHAHWWIPSGLVAVVAARRARVVAVHLHGTDVAIARGPLRPLAAWVLRRASVVLAASPALASWAGEVAGVDAVVAPTPLGLDRVPSPPTPPPVDGPVLAVGRLVPEKGFDVLIRAVASTGDRLVIVGDGDIRPALESLSRSINADVTFSGSVDPGELARDYTAARLVAVPSRREGFGMVAAEALAAGRAVVGTRVGGLPDVVTDGVTGTLVAPDDVGALAAALRSTDPALGANGPATVAWLHPDAIAARNLAAYDAAVRSNRSLPRREP
ncbi:MAG TPA: glycosyltransferase [Acidimicrobiales bacterium]|nr:glycosyltransferase [Acidimicrobiales bacterium]